MLEPPHDPPDTADPGPPSYEPPTADELAPEDTAGTAAAGPGVNTNVC